MRDEAMREGLRKRYDGQIQGQYDNGSGNGNGNGDSNRKSNSVYLGCKSGVRGKGKCKCVGLSQTTEYSTRGA